MENQMDPALFSIDTAVLGESVLIRRLREGDGKVFYELIAENHSLIGEYFPYLTATLSTWEGAEMFVRQSLVRWLLQTAFCFGIWDKNRHTLTGYLEITRRMPECIGELRFFTDRNRVGEGLMSDTLRHMIPYFFDQLRLEKISIKASTENFILPTLARKFGFLREGELRGEICKQSGDRGDVWVYGLCKNLRF